MKDPEISAIEESEEQEEVDKVPSGHTARLSRLGSLAARVGTRFVSNATKRIFSSKEKAREQKENTHLQAAETIAKTLGEMKGLAMKVGQILSYVDGAVPPEFQALYRQTLGKLQSKAPPLPYEKVKEVLQQEFGAPPETLFDEFSEIPFAAASIGQVHRAKFQNKILAVKIQYPDIDKAIETELKDAKLLERVFSPIGKRFNTRATLAEIQSRIREELDYQNEAKNQKLFATCFSDWNEVIVPEVFSERSTKRVLSSELIEGDHFQEILEKPQEEKNRLASILYRFVFEGFYRFHIFNGDPHPGNYLFPKDGRVAFLDYGCALKIVPEDIQFFWDMHVANFEGNIERATEIMTELLEVDRKKKSHIEAIKQYTIYLLKPYEKDEPFHFTGEYAKGTVTQASALLKKTLLSTGSVPTTPARLTFLNRMQWGFVSVLGSLSAEINCYRLLSEIFERAREDQKQGKK